MDHVSLSFPEKKTFVSNTLFFPQQNNAQKHFIKSHTGQLKPPSDVIIQKTNTSRGSSFSARGKVSPARIIYQQNRIQSQTGHSLPQTSAIASICPSVMCPLRMMVFTGAAEGIHHAALTKIKLSIKSK